MLESQRRLFDIPSDVTYLNCASLSPQLHSVTTAGIEAVRAKQSPWTYTASSWFAGIEELRGLFARVVNADADGIAIVPAVSYGVAVAAANVPVDAGQCIVLLDREFPSSVYAWRDVAGRRGATIRTVRRSEGESWTDAVLAAIDATTAVVAVPNCHWTDGALVDLLRVGERARAVGAALVVDASQSVGAHPIDVAEVQPDFLVTVGYKWLLGPYGFGYLYVAPRWRDAGRPIERSWLARAGSENFARLVDYTDGYRPGARRFDAGESSQFVLAPMSRAALLQIHEWGVPAIRMSLAALTRRVADGAAALGGVALAPAERVAHIVGIRLPGGITGELVRSLTEANVHVSIRGDSIRVAPHLYNDERDVDRLLDVLSRATG